MAQQKPSDPHARILRRREVTSRLGVSSTTLHRLMRAGTFPRPVPLGARAVGWLAHEVDAWLDARVRARDE